MVQSPAHGDGVAVKLAAGRVEAFLRRPDTGIRAVSSEIRTWSASRILTTSYTGVPGGSCNAVAVVPPAGIIRAKLDGEQVTVNLSSSQGLALNRKLQIQGKELTVHLLNTGVPHVVVVVDDLEATPVFELGKTIRYHPEFRPRGTNANFMKAIAPGKIAIRTYERGVEAETLACGTGVTASALIYSRLQSIDSPIRVQVRGGDWLEVAFVNAGQEFRDVALTGPADFAFEGAIELP